MATSLVARLRAGAFLAAALAAAALAVYFLLVPSALAGLHPLPLVALLVVTVAVGLWQAWALTRG
ncbi:hypothetical protein [Halorarius halobius]|uniref:hypothetical protein n=1 Tax=Halorarius halobius TaxID=2962671 RepID=UPI0020CF5427|nr:hypothetical protein [Halorarius halobius]